MDPIETIAWLSAELVAARAEIRRLQANLGHANADLALTPDPTLGQEPLGDRRRRRRRTLDKVADPFAPGAELLEEKLSLSDKFLEQPKQMREVIRVLVAGYPRCVKVGEFTGKLTSRRDVDAEPSRNQIGVQISHIRKVFGADSVENVFGEGWRAGPRLLLIFDKARDPEAEADADLASPLAN